MAVSYAIDDEVLRTTVSGAFDLEELRAYRKALLADAAYRPGMLTLVDCRTVTSLPSPEQLRELAQDGATYGAVLQRRARCAVLVGSDAAYGLIRMYSVYTESESSPIELRAFRELEPASAWLSERAGA